MEHAAPAALLGPRTHGHALAPGHHDDVLYLLGGWQGAGLLCWAGQEDPHASGTGLWSATVTFLSVWRVGGTFHISAARRVFD